MATVTHLVQVAVYGTVATATVPKKIVNVFNYFQSAGTVWPPSRVAFTTSFDFNVWTYLAQNISTSWRGDKYTVWFPEIVGDVPVTAGVPSNGLYIGNRLPLQQTLFVQTRSTKRGKFSNGSKRFGPLPAATVVGDELTPTALTGWTVVMPSLTNMIAVPLGSATEVYTPFIWSRTLTGPDPTTMPIIGEVLSSAVPSKVIGTWKHRRERTQR